MPAIAGPPPSVRCRSTNRQRACRGVRHDHGAVMSIAPAHSSFGGSVAARVLRCPASVRLVAKVPAHLRKSSVYADRGTACHTAMNRLIEGECSFDDLVGATIDSYTFTHHDVE